MLLLVYFEIASKRARLFKISAEMCLLSRMANLRFCFIHKYFYDLYTSVRIKLVIVICTNLDFSMQYITLTALFLACG